MNLYSALHQEKLLDASIKTKQKKNNLVTFKSIVRIAKQSWKFSAIYLCCLMDLQQAQSLDLAITNLE